jgi:hypothetical protein
MSTPEDLAQQMAEKTDQELLAMFTSPADWTAQALDSAKAELRKRNVDTSHIDDAPIRCPKCRSTQVTANKEGFGLGKAAVGGILLGPVGLLGGLVGGSHIKITCLRCGHAFQPGAAQ